MPKVQLYEGVGLGLILEYPSGVLCSNQTGGFSCLHPAIQGVFVPLRNDIDGTGPLLGPEAELLAHFEGPKWRGSGATDGIDPEDADVIDSTLRKHGLGTSISVDRSRLRESHEAWIHVLVNGEESDQAPNSVFQGFAPYPRPGVLTWRNSD